MLLIVVRLEDLPKAGEEQTEKDSSLVHKTFDLIFVGVKIQDDDFNKVFFFCLAPRVSDVCCPNFPSSISFDTSIIDASRPLSGHHSLNEPLLCHSILVAGSLIMKKAFIFPRARRYI